MGQVQVNLRVDADRLAAIEGARGRVPRNAWLVAAVDAALGRPAPKAVERVAVPSRPVSVRAPRGCRVVGVPRALQDLPVPIPGQTDVDEALAS